MNKIVPLVLGSVLLGTTFASAAEAAEGWARSGSRLRAGPGSSYPAITRVVAGETLEIYGCLRDWSWCDVSTGDDRGWFPGSRIALTRDGRRVALPGVAALFGLGVLGFERDVYWRDHYRDRPFYGRFEREDRRYAPEPRRAEPPRFEPARPEMDAPPRGDVRRPHGEQRPQRPEPGAAGPTRAVPPVGTGPAHPAPPQPACPPGATACR